MLSLYYYYLSKVVETICRSLMFYLNIRLRLWSSWKIESFTSTVLSRCDLFGDWNLRITWHCDQQQTHTTAQFAGNNDTEMPFRWKLFFISWHLQLHCCYSHELQKEIHNLLDCQIIKWSCHDQHTNCEMWHARRPKDSFLLKPIWQYIWWFKMQSLLVVNQKGLQLADFGCLVPLG